jgi:hypothetical protein
VIRGQPAFEHLPVLTVQPARHHRSCVQIQPNTSFRCGCDCHHYNRLTVNSQLLKSYCRLLTVWLLRVTLVVTLLTVDSGSYTALERISS